MFAASLSPLKLLPTQTDEASLLRLGREVVSLLENRDFHLLAERVRYALAYGKRPAAAIDEALGSCIAECQALPEGRSSILPSMSVKYFKQNASGLFAVVECVFVASEGCPILVELIVT